MRDLPIEVVTAVVENVSAPEDLLHLRCLNWTYRELVTPRLFHNLHIKNSIQSAQNCLHIIATPSLATHVRHVVYDSRDNDRFVLPPDDVDSGDALEISVLEESLTDVFCGITALPKIDHVSLNFWPSFLSQSGKQIRESPFWFTNRQHSLLHAIHHGMPTSTISSLSINNVILPTASYDFVSSLSHSPLSHLSISVVANSDISPWSGSKNVNGSLGALLPPSNPTLKSLILRSPQGPYHSLDTRLSSFHYPSLESLVLENIVFDHMPSPDGVEEFVLRHKDTLRRLELRSCACYVPVPSSPRRWSAICQRWACELRRLRELVVDGDGDGRGYVVLDPDHGYVPDGSVSAVVLEDDSSSLKNLKDAIAAVVDLVA